MHCLDSWLAYIESIHPVSIDMGLARVQAVEKALGLISSSSSATKTPLIVTVAGTNGKGTTLKTLAYLLKQLGYTVGAYTSPHLVHFSERIALNLQPVSDAALMQAFVLVEQARVNLNQSLTYFEFITLAALLIFKAEPLDVLILEIGLGGRLDAVNIIDPDISIITNIGWDHVAYLGNTLEKIATEKAGIIRENKPVILGEGANIQAILNIAQSKQAKVYLRGIDFKDEVLAKSGLSQLFPESVQLAIQALKLLEPKLPDLSPEKIQRLLHDFSDHEQNLGYLFKGRFQGLILNQVKWIIDVAHNSHAVSWLFKNLNQLPCAQDSITHIIWCSFADKDLDQIILEALTHQSTEQQQASHWYVGPLNHPRSALKQVLDSVVTNYLVGKVRQCSVFEHFEQALIQAYHQANSSDRVLVFGSFEAAHAALAFIQQQGVVVGGVA